MNYRKLLILLSCIVAAMLIAGCGGSTTYSVGGTINGLTTSPNPNTTDPTKPCLNSGVGGPCLILQNNGGDNFTVDTTSAIFTFATSVKAGISYDVTIFQQPIGETCTVSNGIGTVQVAIGDITSIVVYCSPSISSSNELTGVVTGLPSGSSVTLLNNGTDQVTVKGTGASQISFAFPTPLVLGASYDVVVSSNPAGATCSVNQPAAGTFPPAVNPTVTCVP